MLASAGSVACHPPFWFLITIVIILYYTLHIVLYRRKKKKILSLYRGVNVFVFCFFLFPFIFFMAVDSLLLLVFSRLMQEVT